jgi:hypothetical protein
MCRSTARTVMNRRPAIVALFAPVVCENTSSSRDPGPDRVALLEPASRGDLRVTSTAGAGTVVVARIPLPDAAVPPSENDPQVPSPRHGVVATPQQES